MCLEDAPDRARKNLYVRLELLTQLLGFDEKICLSNFEWLNAASWMSLVLLLPLLLRPPFYLSIIYYLVSDGQTSALSLGPVDGLQTSLWIVVEFGLGDLIAVLKFG